jgi:hypothetical protein
MKNSLKILLVITLLCISVAGLTRRFDTVINSEGTTQSFVFYDTGEVGSVRSFFLGENPNVLFDVEHLYLPENKIEAVRANYLFTGDGEIYTVDANGFVYHKRYYELDSSVKHFGGNFFVTRSGQIHVVRNDGVLIKYDEIEGVDLRRLKVVGGNYLITNDDRIFMIDFKGYYSEKTELFEDNIDDIKILGHNYMVMSNNILYTFGSETVATLSGTGEVILDDNNQVVAQLDENGQKQYYGAMYRYEDVEIDSIVKVGGNFFFDKEFNVHTISLSGSYDRGIADRKLKVVSEHDEDRSAELPVFFGTNYFVYEDGAFYLLDNDGYYNFVEKLTKRVSMTGFAHELNNTSK